MRFHRTVRHLVCYTYLVWPKFKLGGKYSPGGKRVCEQSNLESLATQGHFDQKFESHQKRKLDLSGNTVWQPVSVLKNSPKLTILAFLINFWPLRRFLSFSNLVFLLFCSFSKIGCRHSGHFSEKTPNEVKCQNVTPFLQLFRQQTSLQWSSSLESYLSTVFENHKKSRIQHCERSEQC